MLLINNAQANMDTKESNNFLLLNALEKQTKPLTKIAFGSCVIHNRLAPLLNSVVKSDSDLFLMIGDAGYPDVNDEFTGLVHPWPSKNTPKRIKEVYQQLGALDDYINLEKNVPIMATWDDHDYGINDGDGSFEYKEESQQLFLDFFNEPKDSTRRNSPGVYQAKTFGQKGHRVQVILLDTRYFRSKPVADLRSDEEKKRLNIEGRYLPSENPEATILGKTQWSWLEQQLREPAEVRLLVSTYPVISNQVGRDGWGNFPLERQRLFNLIEETKANGVIMLSGDVHHSEISMLDDQTYPMIDFTSSSIGADAGDNLGYANPYRMDGMQYGKINFGLIEIDWQAKPSPKIKLSVEGEGKEVGFAYELPLSQLTKY